MLVIAAVVAIAALAAWPYSYFRNPDLDIGIWNGTADALTSKESTVFTYRGGIGLMLRRRWLPHDAPDAADVGVTWNSGWHTGPALSRDEYAMGDAVFDVAGVYYGSARGPHNGVTGPSLVVDRVFALPLWMLALSASAWPIVALRRWRRARGGVGFDVIRE